MSWSFDPSTWTDGVTVPHAADYQHIAADLHQRGANVDGGGYGRANTGFVTLVPGALPGTTYAVTGASWTAGIATLTIGGHQVGVNQLVTLTGALPAGWNSGPVKVTAASGTTISFAMPANPGAWTSGGAVLVGSVPGYGTLAVDAGLNLKVWTGGSWAAATTSIAAGVWWTGSGAPSSSLGSNGDMYVDSATGNYYGPKSGGAWGSIAGSLKGPQGTSGTNGTNGTNASAANWRGAYAAGTTYAQGDGVSDSGVAYISLLAGNTGHTPASSPTYWQGIGSAGLADPGANGIIKRTSPNTTTVAVAATDFYAPGTAIAATDLTNAPGLRDSGSAGIVKRTTPNTTITAVAGTDYLAPGAPTWSALSLSGGVSALAGTFTPSCGLNNQGLLLLSGAVTIGSFTNGMQIAQLPSSSYYPAGVTIETVGFGLDTNDSTYHTVILYISTTGVVTAKASTTAGHAMQVGFDGLGPLRIS